MRISSTRPLGGLDRLLAVIGILGSISLLVFSLFKASSSALYFVLGGSVLAACVIWLARGKALLKTELAVELNRGRTTALLLASAFFFAFALSIISLAFRPLTYERPLAYFVLTSLLFGIIAVEALVMKGRWVYLMLAQVVILGLDLAWSQLLIFPGLLGVDPWYHQMFTMKMITIGSVPLNGSYSELPLYHLLIGSTALTTGLDFKLSMMLSVELLQITCNVLVIYLLARALTKSTMISIFASMLVVLGDYHIIFSYASIPNSLAVVYIPLIIYALFYLKQRKPVISTSLVVLMMVALVLTHTITALCLSIILFVGWGIAMLYGLREGKTSQNISLTLFSFFTVVMLTWWSYASDKIGTLASLIQNGFSKAHFSSLTRIVPKPVGETILDGLGMSIFFAIVLLGTLYMVADRKRENGRILAFIFGTPLVIAAVSMIGGIYTLEMRWLFFAGILLAIPGGIALALLCGSMKKWARAPILAFAITVVSLLLILNTAASVDVHTFAPSSAVRLGLTESEISGAYAQTGVWNGTIRSDNYYGSVFMYFTGIGKTAKPIDANLYNKSFSELSLSLVAIREEIIERPFQVKDGTYKLDYDPGALIMEQGFSRTYDNNMVAFYHKV